MKLLLESLKKGENTMKQFFTNLAAKAQENKDLLIKIGAAAAGAVVGAVVATLIARAQDEMYLLEEENLLEDEIDETDEEDENE